MGENHMTDRELHDMGVEELAEQVEPLMRQFYTSNLGDDEARRIIGALIPVSVTPEDDHAARALTALIMRLAFDDNWQRRGENAITLMHAIYRQTAHYDLRQLIFKDTAVLAFARQPAAASAIEIRH